MIAEDVNFANGEIRLTGTLYRPTGTGPFPVMVVLHAATGGSRNYPFYQHLKTFLPTNGCAVLIFDRRGSGESTGNFATASFDDLAADGLAAFDYLLTRDDVDHKRIGLYGISQGAWIAPIAAAAQPAIAFLIIVSGSGVTPANQMNYGVGYHLQQAGYSNQDIEQVIELRNQVNEYFRGRAKRAEVVRNLNRVINEPWFESAYLGDGTLPEDVTQSKWYYEFDYDPLPIWQKVKQPTLFIFAEVDEWVPISDSLTNYRTATSALPDVTLVQIAGTDHLMQLKGGEDGTQVAEQYLEILSNWLNQKVK